MSSRSVQWALVATGCSQTTSGNQIRSSPDSSTAASSADLTVEERDFLAAMNNANTQMLQRESAENVLAAAHATCDALATGATSNEARQRVGASFHFTYSADLTTVVAYAPQFLCPR